MASPTEDTLKHYHFYVEDGGDSNMDWLEYDFLDQTDDLPFTSGTVFVANDGDSTELEVSFADDPNGVPLVSFRLEPSAQFTFEHKHDNKIKVRASPGAAFRIAAW